MSRPTARGRRKKNERTAISDEDEAPEGSLDMDIVHERHSRVGHDGQTARITTFHKLPPSPTKPTRPSFQLLAPPSDFFEENTSIDTAADVPPLTQDEEIVYDLLQKQPRKMRASLILIHRSKDNPLLQWVDLKKPQSYLDELILLEGRADYQQDILCISCGGREGLYRCRDCFTDDLFCKTCLVDAHQDLPLHRVESQMWNGMFFEHETLKALGLRIQLGHGKLKEGQRQRCRNPARAVNDDFVVIDTYGIHEVGLDFCECSSAHPHDIQLLRARWYPSTSTSPRSAATFNVLRRFHLITLESKGSVSEFYKSIARETDNTGTRTVRDRYDEFARMTREWRHLQMLKRAGRGHDPAGVASTKPGECALLCPACPQPGKNLPADWEKAPREKRFLYALFLALDANFRMRRKKVSNEADDPSLGDGWSFFVRTAPYYDYLARYWKEKQDRSTCVAHDAVDKPDRESRGTASSGIATVDCARHNMKRPNAVGDLQLGERYMNMDYILVMGLAGSEVCQLFVSYDIACQWHKHLWERMKRFPLDIRLHEGKHYCVFLVPKFHLPAHIEACNVKFSFHLTRFVGMTDGEAPERGWSVINPLAGATAEMGPGNRRDTINDAFNDTNHKKILGLGKWVLDRLRIAVTELIEASAEFEELEESIRSLGGEDDLEEWRAEVETWEEDPQATNPFVSRAARKTVAEVRREMAVEAGEEDELEGLTAAEEMHPTELITMGLQLEELQRTLNFDMQRVGNHPTQDQQANMTERTNKLRRKILTWMDSQVLFMPHVALLRAEEDRARMKISATQTQPGIQVQHMSLWLPSALKGSTQCEDDLYEYEFRLREAQAHEALDALRNNLLVRTHLYKYKDRWVRGVKSNTRIGTKIEGVEERVRRVSERYRGARRALEGLGRRLDRQEWQKTLRPLKPEDVRGMPRALFSDPERKKLMMRKGLQARKQADAARRQARARMSWIWLRPGVEDEDAGEGGMNEALRIEWAKTRARFMRRAEEVDLLEEESRRILQFLRWRADRWEESANKRPQVPEGAFKLPTHIAFAPKHAAYAEGNIAYAHRQAAFLRRLADVFETQWENNASFIEMGRLAIGVIPQDPESESGLGLAGADEDTGAEEDGTVEHEDELPVAPRAVPPRPST
ncbi:CxC2 domain-containing protein [Favolaschia claudopus]|uniref:CxC2 domain-containing protein n=1 Tax=Favolaschia claudopus TaxID=2862362 RepID=A0AAW0DAE2_9AGAR